jgi:hypothetical protein
LFTPISSTEADIRDHLAQNLDLIEPGLTLIEKERLLPNDKGARGFIDIFARSGSGQLVIIEIKRSDATARQAIHELTKYVALLKQNTLVKNTEVRLVVASTHWHELLVPFSEFACSALYACEGRQITLGANGLPLTTEPVALVPTELARRLSNRHFIWGFDDEVAASAAVPLIVAHMNESGVTDFVLLLLKIRGAEHPDQRFLYFAQQEQSLDAYLGLIRRRFPSEDVEEFEASIAGLTEQEDKVSEAADKVWSDVSFDDALYTRIGATHAQIAHPDKARYWFTDGNVVSREILRFGRFDDEHLSDETIVAELIGEGGESPHHASIRAMVGSKAEIDALLAGSDNLFFHNSVWRAAVRDLIAYAERNGAFSANLRAFSNDDILRAIAGLRIGYPGFLPMFALTIAFDGREEAYFGIVQWDAKTRPDFNRVISDHFEGDRFNYFTAVHLHMGRGMNADLMADLGLSYGLARVGPDGGVNVRVHGASVSDTRRQTGQPIGAFVKANPAFADALVEMFLEHEQAFGQLVADFMLQDAEARVEQMKLGPNRQEYWSGDIDQCDVCHRNMSRARFMVDGAVSKGGPWGCMCALCFEQVDGEIGWGRGQLYERTNKGWLLVGGGRPDDDDA